MRKSYNGLVALVKNTLEEDPLSGQLFVFINRRRNQCKVLYFERSGYCIWSKRLEQGQFHSRAGQAIKQLLALTELKLIIDGIIANKKPNPWLTSSLSGTGNSCDGLTWFPAIL